MRVNLGGIVPLSTVDWPGRASLVVFLRGCPLRCPHCQNSALQKGRSLEEFHAVASRVASLSKGETREDAQIDLEEASIRVSARPFVDAIVLSGGEPLLQPRASARLLSLARSLGLATAIETSGCYPERLGPLLQSRLVDRVFLDLKAPLREQAYEMATGRRGVAARVQRSLEMCMSSRAPLEARLTVFPEMPQPSHILEVAAKLERICEEHPDHRLEALVLQQGRPSEGECFEPVAAESLRRTAELLDGKIAVRVRGVPVRSWKGR